jgi:hypothetical protein
MAAMRTPKRRARNGQRLMVTQRAREVCRIATRVGVGEPHARLLLVQQRHPHECVHNRHPALSRGNRTHPQANSKSDALCSGVRRDQHSIREHAHAARHELK